MTPAAVALLLALLAPTGTTADTERLADSVAQAQDARDAERECAR